MTSSEDSMTRRTIYLEISPGMAPIQGACGASCIFLMSYLFELCNGFSSPQNFAGIANRCVLCGPLRNGDPFSCGTFVSVRHDTGIRGHRAVGRMQMMSSPTELWQSYLGALDAYPLLTKVRVSLRVVCPSRSSVTHSSNQRVI